MNEQAPVEVSALLDGELDHDMARDVLDSVIRSDSLQARWDAYVLIGDRLRDDAGSCGDISVSVMARLRDEPIVLSPGRLQPPMSRSPLLAIAASIAGVAIVGWMAFVGHGDTGAYPMERVALQSSPGTVLAKKEPAVQGRSADSVMTHSQISEYLVAHHTQASTFRLGDSPEHVRSVALAVPYNNK